MASAHHYDEIQKITNFLLSKTTYRPTISVICGSGMGDLKEAVESQVVIDYKDIPGFPISTVQGHQGQLVFGTISDKTVVLMQGRCHMYEGESAYKITIPIRVLCNMGVKTMVITNAAGGINRSFKVGDIMIMKDHISFPCFSGYNPLIGPNDNRFGPRFPAMSNAYDSTLRQTALSIAKTLGYSEFLREGVYCMLSGPNYETPAECRLLSVCGADATGMSTVPEVIVARHMGVRCLGISLITNITVMDYDTNSHANHEEVMEVGRMRSGALIKLVQAFIKDI